MESQYVYLIQEREFANSKEKIYKIGKSKQINFTRFMQYPKGSILISQITCHNCDSCESEMISFFKKKYIQRKDIGLEYFEGDYRYMILDIQAIITKQWRNLLDLENDTEEEEEIEVQEDTEEEEEETEDESTFFEILTEEIKPFYCDICKYFTSTNGNLQKHFKSSKHIINLQPQTVFHPSKYDCEKCKKNYKGLSGLWRHNKVCKPKTVEKKINQETLLNTITKMNKDILELKKKKIKIKNKQIHYNEGICNYNDKDS
jgi:hypothetical protein